MRRTALAACFLLASAPAFAQGFGGTTLPAEPGMWRFEVDGGFSIVRFSQFTYGDFRAGFPAGGSPFIRSVFDNGRDGPAYNVGGRAAYGTAMTLFGAPVEVFGRFHYFQATSNTNGSETGAGAIFVPYIDGLVRTTLVGGSVVGLFGDSHNSLQRRLTGWEGEFGARLHFVADGFRVSPGLFFDYQRLEQRDLVTTFVATDPPQHALSAVINSNHYRLGATIRVSRPVWFEWLVLTGNVAGGVDFVQARYRGSQTFGPSGIFNEPFEINAVASDSKSKIGGFAAFEGGAIFVIAEGVSLSVLGHVRYVSAVPRVIYPTPITGTTRVDGPARLGFQDMLMYGGMVNFSVRW
jgi:hypothetical protein